MLHSEMMKKIGGIAMCIGFVLIVAMAVVFFALQSISVVWGYMETVGVYFVVIGCIAWLIGAGIEYRDQKIEEEKTKQQKSSLFEDE